MTDLLYVSFDKDEKRNETGMYIGRPNEDGSHTILNMLLDKDAELLYKVLTTPNMKLKSKGHWIQQPRCEGDEQPDLVCPNCGFKISWWDMGNFCAKCGTGLEGGAG